MRDRRLQKYLIVNYNALNTKEETKTKIANNING